MASAKQTLANKNNARRSTGPKTKEGKARSANNIIKYNDQRASNKRQINE